MTAMPYGLPQLQQYNSLQTLGVARDAEQNHLAKLAREKAGAAFSGDPQAMNDLAGLDPNMALNISQERRLGAQDQQAEQARKVQEVASVYSAADTPEKFNQAVTMLRQQGYNVAPEEADFNNRDFVIAKAKTLAQHIAEGKDARDFAFDREKFAFEKQKHADTVAGGGNEYGLQPVWGTDADGNPVLYQISKGGGAPQQVQFPEGVKPSPGYSTVDVGTGFAPVNKRTGVVQGDIIPKDVAGEETQKTVGKGVGEAKVALPDVEASADLALKAISDIRNSPGRVLGTGWSSFGNFVPGTPGYDFQQLVDQAAGGAFLQAFQTLRGGGQITEVEGKKATQAIARMQTAQSEGAFLKALDDYEEVIKAGVARARKKAGQTPTADGGGEWTTLPSGVRIRQKQ